MRATQTQITSNYQDLINKYNIPSDKPLVIDAKQIDHDLKLAISLFNDAKNHNPTFDLAVAPAQLFICKDIIYKRVSFTALRDLILIDRQSALNAFEKHPKTKQHLNDIFKHLKAERKKYNLPSRQLQDCEFIALLLSVPNHAALFNWQEVQQIFKNQDPTEGYRALKLASNSENYKKEFIATLNLSYNYYSDYYQATANLTIEELTNLLTTSAEKEGFLKHLIKSSLASNLVQTWPVDNIKWLIQQITRSPNNNEPDQTQILSSILSYLARYNDKLFLQQLMMDEILALVPEQFFINIFDSKLQVTNFLLNNLIAKVDYLSKQSPAVAYALCKKASLQQFEELLKISNIKQGLKNHINTKKNSHAVYDLLSSQAKAHENGSSKAEHLISKHNDVLNALSPIEILDLAINNDAIFNLTAAKVEQLLSRSECWQAYDNTKNRSEINGEKLLGLDKTFFNKFMKHNFFVEAWLRQIIADPSWDKKGQGFFEKKNTGNYS